MSCDFCFIGMFEGWCNNVLSVFFSKNTLNAGMAGMKREGQTNNSCREYRTPKWLPFWCNLLDHKCYVIVAYLGEMK